jgi:hypothetical protein
LKRLKLEGDKRFLTKEDCCKICEKFPELRRRVNSFFEVL